MRRLATFLMTLAVGLIYALVGSFNKSKSSAEPIPFGPFLSIAGWITLLFRDSVLSIFLP